MRPASCPAFHSQYRRQPRTPPMPCPRFPKHRSPSYSFAFRRLPESRRAIAIIARSLFLFCHAPAQSGRDSSGFGAPGRQKAKPVSTKSVHPTSPAAEAASSDPHPRSWRSNLFPSPAFSLSPDAGRRSHAPPHNLSAQKPLCEIRIFPHGPVCRSLKIRNGTDPQQETIPLSRRSGVEMSPHWKGGVRAPC